MPRRRRSRCGPQGRRVAHSRARLPTGRASTRAATRRALTWRTPAPQPPKQSCPARCSRWRGCGRSW
eukprot:scaffold18679_cov124-Isochrysis_galbana.AAC.2